MTTYQEISRPDKVLYPDRGYSQADLAEYYELMALHAIYHELLGLIPNARSLN